MVLKGFVLNHNFYTDHFDDCQIEDNAINITQGSLHVGGKNQAKQVKATLAGCGTGSPIALLAADRFIGVASSTLDSSLLITADPFS